MFDNARILPWQRRQSEALKERVRTISLIHRSERASGISLQDSARSLSQDWGFEIQQRGQAMLPLDLPPAA